MEYGYYTFNESERKTLEIITKCRPNAEQDLFFFIVIAYLKKETKNEIELF